MKVGDVRVVSRGSLLNIGILLIRSWVAQDLKIRI